MPAIKKHTKEAIDIMPHRDCKNTPGAVAALATVLCLAAGSAPPAAGDPQAGDGPDEPRQKRDWTASALKNIWWNQPEMVEDLDLTKSQRERMDALLLGHMDRRQAALKSQKASIEGYIAALTSRDRAAALSQIADLRAGGGLIAASYAELTVDVIFMLDEEQHQKIASNYRHLLERPWLRQTKLGGRGQRRPAGGQGPGPG